MRNTNINTVEFVGYVTGDKRTLTASYAVDGIVQTLALEVAPHEVAMGIDELNAIIDDEVDTARGCGVPASRSKVSVA